MLNNKEYDKHALDFPSKHHKHISPVLFFYNMKKIVALSLHLNRFCFVLLVLRLPSFIFYFFCKFSIYNNFCCNCEIYLTPCFILYRTFQEALIKNLWLSVLSGLLNFFSRLFTLCYLLIDFGFQRKAILSCD